MTETARRRWWRPWKATEDPPADSAAAESPPAEAPAAEAELPDQPTSELQASSEPREGWFARLRAGLSHSSNRLRDNISGILTRRRLDTAALEEL